MGVQARGGRTWSSDEGQAPKQVPELGPQYEADHLGEKTQCIYYTTRVNVDLPEGMHHLGFVMRDAYV